MWVGTSLFIISLPHSLPIQVHTFAWKKAHCITYMGVDNMHDL